MGEKLCFMWLWLMSETWLIKKALVHCVRELHVCLKSVVHIFLLKSASIDQELWMEPQQMRHCGREGMKPHFSTIAADFFIFFVVYTHISHDPQTHVVHDNRIIAVPKNPLQEIAIVTKAHFSNYSPSI